MIRMNALYDKGKEEVNRFGFVPCIEYLIGEVPNPDFIVIPSHLEKRIIDDLKRYKSEQSNP